MPRRRCETTFSHIRFLLVSTSLNRQWLLIHVAAEQATARQNEIPSERKPLSI